MKYRGYRVVAKSPKGLVTLYGQDPVVSKIGHIDQPGGQGLFLGNTPEFATDYYGGLTEYPDVLLTYEFDEADLIRGEPDAVSSELVVRKAKLVDMKQVSESLEVELKDIRKRAGLQG